MDGQRSHLGAFLAAGSLFTRLPFWRVRTLTKADYEDALSWWPVVGLITGLTLGGSFYLLSLFLPKGVALALALAVRLLLTGGFHEDGLGDFFDGFGGGRTKEQVLAIMKDSHVGSYAVLALVLYYLVYWSSATAIPSDLVAGSLLASDVSGKFFAFLQVQRLPYARAEAGSKVGVVYREATELPWLLGLGALLWTQWIVDPFVSPLLLYRLLLLLLPLTLSLALQAYMRKRIGGYTGDTCGALCLLCELATLLGYTILAHARLIY